ncbi:hypothetical protein P5F75_14490, partial [Caldifermentibacillus hisashii]|uniref:hypothetical protein n=1 Tax=Caldifermentibacillus hisashii TaxID=996558 RepID=UPI002E1E14F8|nr:hypothetical protein [Caldifermentibacillus hisashii]
HNYMGLIISSPFLVWEASILTTRLVLVAVFGLGSLYFDDETRSRHRFWSGNAQFWRRDPFSSPFLVEKASILTTRLVLVTVLGRKKLNFGDETQSRHHFWLRNACFWRRGPFSSPFWVEKSLILATRSFLVAVLGKKIPNFDDEARSRRRFWSRNAQFWRRNPISSPFLVEKASILATRFILATYPSQINLSSSAINLQQKHSLLFVLQ